MKTLLKTALFLIIFATACSVAPPSSSSNSVLEQQLQEVLGSSDYFVGVDQGNTFVAIPVSGVKKVVKNILYLKGGTTIAMKKPVGAYDAKEFALGLISELKRPASNSFSFTTDRNGNLISSGSTHSVRDNYMITVTKIIDLE